MALFPRQRRNRRASAASPKAAHAMRTASRTTHPQAKYSGAVPRAASASARALSAAPAIASADRFMFSPRESPSAIAASALAILSAAWTSNLSARASASAPRSPTPPIPIRTRANASTMNAAQKNDQSDLAPSHTGPRASAHGLKSRILPLDSEIRRKRSA